MCNFHRPIYTDSSTSSNCCKCDIGIPDQEKNPPAAPASGQAVNPPSSGFTASSSVSGQNANPLDLFPQGLPNVGSIVGAGNLDFLSNSSQLQDLRAMVQANPQILQPMLQELGKQNLQLMRRIQEHQADVLCLIYEPAEGGGNVPGQMAGAIRQAVTVTPEQREGIVRAQCATSTGQSTQTVAPQATVASVTPAQSATESAPAPAPAAANPSTDVYVQAASNLVAGSTLETRVQEILDMSGGSWDRDTVVLALRAASNNPERAIEYLYSGIPEQEKTPPAAPAIGQAVNPPVQASQPAVPSSVRNANPLDLFPQGLPNVGSNVGAGNLDFLSNSPQLQDLRAMVQGNPQILLPMLQELGKQNPQLMRLIQEHQADVLCLINEPAEGGGNVPGQLAGVIRQAVTVTPEEREGIERVDGPVHGVNPNGGDVNLDDGVENLEPAEGSRGRKRKRSKGVKCNPQCICTSRGCPCRSSE